jgi:hypothetical protein
MKQTGQMWVMLPKGMAVPTTLAVPLASSAKVVKK